MTLLKEAEKGSELIARLGYPAVADIIAAHMLLAPEHWDQINETTIVYLADKLILGDKVVSLEVRLNERLNRFKDSAARQYARERIRQAMAIQKKVESILGMEIQRIWR